MSQYPETPMLDKLMSERSKTQAIHDFLEWAAETHDVHLGQYAADPGHEFYQRISSDDLLAEFIGVDMSVVEQEKEAILAHVREQNDNLANLGSRL